MGHRRIRVREPLVAVAVRVAIVALTVPLPLPVAGSAIRIGAIRAGRHSPGCRLPWTR